MFSGSNTLPITLKGALQNLSAEQAPRVAFKLERMARAGELKGSEQIMVDLKDELNRLGAVLCDWSKEASV